MISNSLQLLSRVKFYREKIGFSQQDLADRIGSSLETIKQVELSCFVPSVRLALLLSLALDVPVESLFYFEIL